MRQRGVEEGSASPLRNVNFYSKKIRQYVVGRVSLYGIVFNATDLKSYVF